MADLPSWKEMFETLVALPSISSADPEWDTGNRQVIDRLGEWLEDLGFSCRIESLAEQPDKYNLVATLNPSDGHDPAGLALCGHSDTVPYDEDAWDSDPFTLTERDNRLYGLGSCDMKGFLVLAVEATRRLGPHTLRRPLSIVATADEESGMDGARALRDAGVAPARCAVIGEPTGLRPVRMHKGILMESLRVNGAAGHSSNPGLGLNAIEGMQRVMTALLGLRDELRRRENSPEFTVPHTTMNLGRIHGGDSANRIPAACELHVDLRFLPGTDMSSLREELYARARQALDGTQYGLECLSLFEGNAAFDTPREADIVRAAEEVSGQTAGAVDFATEGALFNELGMQSVVMGPGYIDQAHQPNEYLALDFVEPTLDMLTRLIRRYCL